VQRPIGIAGEKIVVVGRDCDHSADVVNPAVGLYDFPLSDVYLFLVPGGICYVQLGLVAGCNHGIGALGRVIISAGFSHDTGVLCYDFSVFDGPLEHGAVPAKKLGI
jgi:hypothetical protein